MYNTIMRVSTLLINAEISRLYNVSEPTVSKWVKSAMEGKNSLELTKIGNRMYVLDTQHNRDELRRLAQIGFKYRNKLNQIVLYPNTDLYSVFSFNQMVDLVTALEDTRSIPLKFSYFGQGANIWDEFSVKMYQNMQKEADLDYYVYKSAKLLSASLGNLLLLINKYSTINLFDVGTGNGQALVPVIDVLLENGYKVNYTGIDISKNMLEIAQTNLKNWYPQMCIKTELADIDYAVIKDRLFASKIKHHNSCNLVFFLGSTIGNVQDRKRVLSNFADSMGQHDYFIVDNVLDTPSQRTQFSTSKNSKYEAIMGWIPNLLGFRHNMVEVCRKYDQNSQSRVQTLKLKNDIQLIFDLQEGKKKIELLSGQEIQVWNHHSHTMQEMLDELKMASMSLKYFATFPDQTHCLAITSK